MSGLKFECRISKYETNPNIKKMTKTTVLAIGCPILRLSVLLFCHLHFEFVSNFGFRALDLSRSIYRFMIQNTVKPLFSSR